MEQDYGGAHRPPGPGYGAPIHDLTALLPEDVYTHPQFYDTSGDGSSRKNWSTFRRVRGKPHEMVDIYRSLPPGQTKFNHGDWVAIRPEYAAEQNMHATDPNQDMPVIRTKVPAHTLYTSGDSLDEFGYWGPAMNGQLHTGALDWADQVNGMPYSFGGIRLADAEEAKASGGMIALYPRPDFAQMLSVPGGEPEDDMHLTLVFLGDDVSTIDPGALGAVLGRIADSYVEEISARVFGHALFNPDGAEGRDPCGVYLVGHSPELAQLHRDVREAAENAPFPIPEQHDPWCPHMTASYASQMDGTPLVGEYTGEVIFDRLGLALAGNTQFFPFVGVTSTERAAYFGVY